MNQSTPLPENGKPCRSLRLVEQFAPDGRGVVAVSERKSSKRVEVKTYVVQVFASDFGLGVSWTNLDTREQYHVNLDTPHSSCSCAWGTYGTGKPCRHIAGSQLLLDMGKLCRPPVEEAFSEQPVTDRTGRYVLVGA